MGTKPEEETASRGAVGLDSDSGGSAAEGSRADGRSEEADPDARAPGRPVSNPLLPVSIALVVVAAACAGWFGWSWYAAAHDDSLSYSRVRDKALQAGEQAIKNLNTLDYRNMDQGLRIWLDSSTGDLHNEIVQGREQFEQQIKQAKTTSTAKVLDGAVTELNERAGKASVIVALQITVTPSDGEPTTKLSRLEGELTKTVSGWKLSAVGQVPAGTTVDSVVTPGQ